MSKFSERQIEQQERKEKNSFVRQQMVKTVHNMAVVSFTGMVIGCFASVMQQGKITWMHFAIAVLVIIPC